MKAEADQILRARAGDERALEGLIRVYQSAIAGFIAARVSDRHAIPDLCQTAFVKMVLSIKRLQSPEAFEPWLFRIAENVSRDFLRRERWRRRLFLALEREQQTAASEPTAERAQAEAQLAAVRSSLGQVGPRERELLVLSLEESRSYDELAELTHSSVPAVKSRLFRARARLRQLLRRGETEHGS